MNIKRIICRIKRQHLAFTLAEVMVAMTIVGVLAVMTIPTMIVNVHANQYKSGVKKAHSLVSESFDSMKSYEDASQNVSFNYIYNAFNTPNRQAQDFRVAYMEFWGFDNTKYAGQDASYYDNYYHTLHNKNVSVDSSLYNGGGFQARNGMTVLIGKVPKPDTDSASSGSSTALIISVDIDGPKKGENQLGVDIFCFEVMPSDNILPVGAKSTEENTTSFDAEHYCVSPYNSDVLNGIACSYQAVYTADYMNETLDSKDEDPCNCGFNMNSYATCNNNGTISCSYGRVQQSGTCLCVCPTGYSENSYGLCCKEDGSCYDKEGSQQLPCNGKQVRNKAGNCVCSNKAQNDECDTSADGACGENGVEWNSQCVICQLGKANSTQCKCITDKQWSDCQGNCVEPINSFTGKTWDENTCKEVCPSGKEETTGGICCDAQTSYGLKLDKANSNSKTGCVYDCGAGTYTSGKCICSDNAVHKIQSTGSDYSECVCNAEKHFTKATNGSCVCETGRKLTGESCYCENGSKEDDCGCDASYGLISSTTAGKCKCNTANGFKESGDVDVTYKGCACDAKHADPDIENGTLVCKCNGKGRSGADCSCGGGSTDTLLTENGNADDCTCKNGYEINSEGSCVCNGTETTKSGEKYCEQTCKNGAKWSSSKNQCECDLQYAEISDDSCVCTLSGMTYNSTQNACICSAENATITYNAEKQEYECTQGGTSCTSTGQKRINNACQCMDGSLKVQDEASTQARDDQVSAMYQAQSNRDASDEEKQQFQCYCPDGYSLSASNLTATKKAGESYTKLLCENTACTSSYGTWNSEGGDKGYCSCGDSKYIESSNNTCTCKGEDVKALKDVGSLTCECVDIENSKGTKLEYDTTKYTCVAKTGDIEGYYLSTKEDIEQAKVLIGSYKYVLTNDITIDSWTPWGTTDAPFSGNFDGKGKTITVESSITGTNNVGFFGVTGTGCNISNLTLKVANVTGKVGVGALVGSNNCTLKNVKVILSGTVSGEKNVGGIVGTNAGTVEYATIIGTKDTDTNNKSTITGQTNIGGAIGYNSETGNISYGAVNNVKIQGYYETTEGETTTKQNSQYIGGFAGYNMYGTIENSYVSSDVTVGTYIENKGYFGEWVGGFVGENTGNKGQGIILNSYTQANINAYSRAGGFVGYMGSGVLENVYTINRPSSAGLIYIGGFMGDFNSDNSVSIIKSFYKSDSTDKTDACGYSADTEKGRYKNYEASCGGSQCDENRGLYPKQDEDLKNPQTYLCAEWLPTYKNIWYFPQTSSGYDYPQIINNYSCQAGGAKFKGDTQCVTCSVDNEYYAKTTENKVGCLPMVKESGGCDYQECICLITQCDIGEHYDTQKGICVAACSINGQSWSYNDNKCMCPSDMTAGETSCECSAKNNAYYEGYGCIDCTKYAKSYDGTKDVCVCDTGYYFEEAGMMCISDTATKVE